MKLPESFIATMKGLLNDEYVDFEQALEQEPSVSIRINKNKMALPGNLKSVPWCSTGFYLSERPAFTFDPRFHAGNYYVQEASSMFVEQIINTYIDSPVRYLDLCAAPGGKTTLAISTLPEGSLIVANEIDRKRCNILSENITKWGNPYTIVTNNGSEHFAELEHYFDVILCDVPCSGEGMFRKDENAIDEWSVANVENCVARQKMIIDNINHSLRPGGILIYSTCTYNIHENEEMIEYIRQNIDAEVLEIKTSPEWGIHKPLSGNNPVYRFMPHTTKGEGLFIAVLRKNSEEEPTSRDYILKSINKADNKKGKNQTIQVPASVKNYISNNNIFEFSATADSVVAMPKKYADDFKALSKALRVVSSGIEIANFKGKDIIPAHSLALSTYINKDEFEIANVDRNTALSFLRREAITLSEDINKGYVLICYDDSPIGWVKNLGNRSNNLYPQEWRIRSGFTPENLELGF